MEKDTKLMYKKILFINGVIAVLLTTVIFFTFSKYTSVFFAGFIVAILNFLLNGLMTSFALTRSQSKILIAISFFIRITLVAGLGYLFFTYNKLNVVAYMAGYSSQLLGFIFYALSIKK